VSEEDSGSIGDRLPVVLGLVLSAIWVGFIVLYVRGLPDGLKGLSPGQAAALLAGTGGPLAAFWLFLSVIEQRRRLVVLTHAIGDMMRQHRHTLQLAETQTRTLIEFQAQTKRARTAETRRLAFQDLGAHVAVLAERLGVIRRDGIDMAWARFGSGDITAFVQPFLNFAASHPDMGERLAEAVGRDPIAATALHGFVRRYEALAAEAGDDRMVQAIIEEGALGRAFRLFKPATDAAARQPLRERPEETLPPPQTARQVEPPETRATLAPPPSPPPPQHQPAARAAAEPQLELSPKARDDLEARLHALSERLDDGLTKAFRPER
jgi:hypothetical protein